MNEGELGMPLAVDVQLMLLPLFNKESAFLRLSYSTARHQTCDSVRTRYQHFIARSIYRAGAGSHETRGRDPVGLLRYVKKERRKTTKRLLRVANGAVYLKTISRMTGIQPIRKKEIYGQTAARIER